MMFVVCCVMLSGSLACGCVVRFVVFCVLCVGCL